MLNLQTKVKIPNPNFTINYSENISLFGSCFSDNIGNLLAKQKFNTCINPFGVLYNPASISQAINLLFSKEKFYEEDLDFFNEKWFSYYHHTSFSSVEKADCLKAINDSFIKAKGTIANSNTLIITLGTAWVYRQKLLKQVVANCHKIPASEFDREYLNPDNITSILSESIKKVLKANPKAKIIFTVSPIRHWKDGAIENMRSKSSLILAIKSLQEIFKQVYYFPSYEIFMDELRDYRFYASDMLHPSDLSINYIWEKFRTTFFNEDTIQVIKQVDKLNKSFGHRHFNTNTEQYARFKEKLIKDSKRLENKYSYLNFSEERRNLK